MNGSMNCGMVTTDKTALHPPSPWTMQQMIHWPLILSNKQRGKGLMKTSRTVYYNNADRRVSLSVAPPTFWNWSETPFQAIPWDQFIPDVLQLVTGAATSLSRFIRRCHLFHLATQFLEVGHLILPASTDGGQGY